MAVTLGSDPEQEGDTQYLWQGAPIAFHAQGERSTCNHMQASDTEQETE